MMRVVLGLVLWTPVVRPARVHTEERAAARALRSRVSPESVGRRRCRAGSLVMFFVFKKMLRVFFSFVAGAVQPGTKPFTLGFLGRK